MKSWDWVPLLCVLFFIVLLFASGRCSVRFEFDDRPGKEPVSTP